MQLLTQYKSKSKNVYIALINNVFWISDWNMQTCMSYIRYYIPLLPQNCWSFDDILKSSYILVIFQFLD